MPIVFAVALAVGPAAVELDRTADLVESLCSFEGGPWYLVMVDDGREDRALDRAFGVPPGCRAVSLRRAKGSRDTRYRRGKGICDAILQALGWIAREAPDARFTVKLDTDALVIGPFSEKIADTLAASPDVGMLGAYDRTPNGDPRDFSTHARTMRGLLDGPGLLRRLTARDGVDGGHLIKERIEAALANGYRLGEHCLGGAYGVSDEFLRRMDVAGYLQDAPVWCGVDCPEDVMIGMYTKAVGLRHMNFVGSGEVFGVRYQGLPDAPEKLIERGYSVIHSVKSYRTVTEGNVRAFFRRQRHSA